MRLVIEPLRTRGNEKHWVAGRDMTIREQVIAHTLHLGLGECGEVPIHSCISF